MGIALAFLRRDALIWASYRFALVWQALGTFLFIGFLYFVGTIVGSGQAPFAELSEGYVAFALSGVAFTDVMTQALYAIAHSVRENQKAGTLEPVLLTPIGVLEFAVSSSAFRMLLAVARMLIYFVFGAFVLGYWRDANFLSLLIVFVPALVTFVAIGTLSAAFVILVKEGDPVLVVYSAITAMLSGVLFPVSALPAWTAQLSALLPLTYALEGLRAGLAGAAPTAVAGPALVLVIMAAILFPLGIASFTWAADRAKREGSLTQY